MPTSTKSSKCLHDIIYPNSKYDLLIIPQAQKLKMYDLDVIPYLETLSHSGARYVSWSYLRKLMVEHFPDLDFAFEKDPKTQQIYHLDQTIVSLGEKFWKKTNSSFDKKTRSMKTEEVFDFAPYLLPFIYNTKTFARTDAVYYPIMATGNKPCYGLPDNMTLNKNQQRAKVKAAADNLLIGLRLWSGEDFDSDKPQMLLKMRQLNEQYLAAHGKSHPEYANAHFGLSSDQLVKIGQKMAADVRILKGEPIDVEVKQS